MHVTTQMILENKLSEKQQAEELTNCINAIAHFTWNIQNRKNQ